MSSKLSGTYQNAVIAAKEYENIRVVDSETGSVGEQLLVRYALMLRDKGREIDDIVHRLEVRKKQIRVLALLDTLEYVKRVGDLERQRQLSGLFFPSNQFLPLRMGKSKYLVRHVAHETAIIS